MLTDEGLNAKLTISTLAIAAVQGKVTHPNAKQPRARRFCQQRCLSLRYFMFPTALNSAVRVRSCLKFKGRFNRDEVLVLSFATAQCLSALEAVFRFQQEIFAPAIA